MKNKAIKNMDKSSEISNAELLKREQRNSSVILAAVLISVCLWVLIYALWEKLGRPISQSNMSIAVLGLAMAVCVVIVIFSDIKIVDLGVAVKNAKRVFLVDTAIAIVGIVVLVLGKILVIKLFPERYFDMSQPFMDFRIFARLPILYYPVNVIVQEFVTQGVLHECLRRAFVGKNSGMLALVVSSLVFGVFHIHMGIVFMLSASVMLGFLGVLYSRQKTFWGLCIPHYCIGITATMLGWI